MLTGAGIKKKKKQSNRRHYCTLAASALFSLPQSSKFFHSLSITSIFNRLHGLLNVDKKNN
jgi:hypothetical protein